MGDREFSEDERWLYRIEPGSDAPKLTRSLPKVTAPLPPIRSGRPTTSQTSKPRHRGAASVSQPQTRHRWPRPYEVAAGACASAAATGVVGGLGIGGTMIGSCRHEFGHCLRWCAVYAVFFPDSPQCFRSSPTSRDVGPHGRSGPRRERAYCRRRGAVVGAIGRRGSRFVGAPSHRIT